MTGGGGATASGEFGAGYWEDRYRRGEGTGRQAPSPSLVAEAAALPPGRALDAGCGRGADAVWLALRGWSVTAVDVSATALAGARESARAAGAGVADGIEWIEADLTTWDGGGPVFDLVTCQYVHVPGPAEDLFRRLVSWVAPGGRLLVAGHDSGRGSHGHHGRAVHDHPPGSQIRAEQVTACLDEDQWEVLVAEPRTHVRRGGGGEVSHDDVVVHARRRDRPAR